ncbi:MAG: putative Diguanylate cyclase/phosphodiesterase [Frankiales bacterium]|nr:putative Diguanylate cyclase/phosphodiesterase [Frankiales bacterium]
MRAGRQTATVAALTVLLTVIGLTVVPVTDRAPRLGNVALHWTLLAAAFGITEIVVLHIQVRREAQTVSLSEAVTVLALFFTSPLHLVLARTVAGLLVCSVHRRSPALKSMFNAALFAAEAAVATHVFQLIAASDGSFGPRSWGAAAAAVLVSCGLGIFALQAVVAVYEGGFSLRAALREAVVGQVLTPLVTAVALVGVLCLSTDVRSAWLLVVPAVGLLLGYRAYALLSDRHLSLERLYRFSQVVTSSPEIDAVLRSVLTEARELLRAEHVAIDFLPAKADAHSLQVRLGPDGALQRTEVDGRLHPDWLHELVVSDADSLLAARGTRVRRWAEWLATEGHREVIVVPLRGEAGVIGSLRVSDRMGEVRAFDANDVLLLETVANHAGISLQNGRLVDQLRHDALHDALTGLPNRVQLQRALAEAAQAVVDGRRPGAAVMVLDLDGFKQVNDTLGHACGDRLLQEVSHRLVSAVGTHGLVARLGGDEFAVVLPSTSAQAEVLATGGRILGALATPVDLDGVPVTVGASIGIALAPAHGTEPTVLLKHADMAMYGAKASAGGLRLFRPDLDTDDRRQLVLVTGLRAALAGGCLEVHLQPIADLATGTVRGVEALVRWFDPDLGDVRPDELVPAAERSGLIGRLTSFVLDAALGACAALRADGLEMGVSVNLSTRSLDDDHFVTEVDALLARHGIPGRLLTLEVTEGVVLNDPRRAAVLMTELRSRGIRLSLDDFGTGYSSLSYLTRLPVDEIKVDKSFVARMASRSEDLAVVRSVAELGRGLRLDVVAEGVEDAASWQALTELGCTHGQGWHLARPMALPELRVWLAGRPAPIASSRPGPARTAVPAPTSGLPALPRRVLHRAERPKDCLDDAVAERTV